MSAVGQVVDGPTEAIGGHRKAPHQKTKTLTYIQMQNITN